MGNHTPPLKAMLTNLISEEEVMKWLKASRSKMQRLRHMQDDPIPFLLWGREYRYEPEKVMKWMERQTKRKVGAQ